MTRERFEVIQREFRMAIASQPSSFIDSLWGETIEALGEAWAERDAAIRQRDERALRAAGLMDQVKDLRKGHDRYEIARRLSPSQWADAWKLNISTGKPFDEIIDDLWLSVRSKQDWLQDQIDLCEGKVRDDQVTGKG